MVFNLRKATPTPKAPITPRWFAGLSISTDATRIDAALIGVHGQGSGAPLEIQQAMSFDLDGTATRLYDELLEAIAREQGNENNVATYRDGFPRTFGMESRLQLIQEINGIEEEAFQELTVEAGLPLPEIQAIGIGDPGIRFFSSRGQRFESLCDPERLSVRTGMNIIDAFPKRDIAAGGHGGPVYPLPTWILLKSGDRDRILIDIGKTAKLTWIPCSMNLAAARQIHYHEVVPCGELLNALTYALTKGETTIDLGGRLTVQGCQIPELLAGWSALAAREPNWSPYGLAAEPYLHLAFHRPSAGWAIRDILCTAAHFIAEEVASAVKNLIKQKTTGTGRPEPELILIGGARHHGLLLNRLSALLDNRSFLSLSQLGIPVETLDALDAAIMALMFADQLSGNLPHLTGAEREVSLGRITPGAPQHWQRLLQSMSTAKPAGRPLRAAM